jgi:putative thioredoxin
MGALPEREVRHALESFVPTEADELVGRAAELAREGRSDEAEPLYRRALAKARDHQGALAGLALIALEKGELARARETAARIDEGTPEHQVAERVFALVDFRERCAELPGRAEAERALSEDPDDLDAAFALGTCLAADGDYEGALERFLGILRKDKGYGDGAARDAMVRVFSIVGKRSELADRYRSRMALALY